MDRSLGWACLDVVDMVLARRQNLAMKERVLEETGRWFADLVK